MCYLIRDELTDGRFGAGKYAGIEDASKPGPPTEAGGSWARPFPRYPGVLWLPLHAQHCAGERGREWHLVDDRVEAPVGYGRYVPEG